MELRVEKFSVMGYIRRIAHFTPLLFISYDRAPNIMRYGKAIGWPLSATSASIGGGRFVTNELFMPEGVANEVIPLSAGTRVWASLKLRNIDTYRYRKLFQTRSLKI